MEIQEPYCEGIIREIGDYYFENIYEHITIPICLVGMVLNLLNVLVFTRKTMHSPPNLILAHLAFVDVLVLLTSIVNFWINFIQPKSGFNYEESYVLSMLYYYGHLSIVTFQFISAFLTVQLAAWRYIAVVHPLKERNWCNKKITRNVVFAGYLMCCVSYAVPYHLSWDVDTSNSYEKIYYTFTSKRHPIMSSIRDIIYGLMMKLLPSVVLVGLTSRIVVTLLARKTRREQLTSSASARSNMKNTEMRQQTNRSTAILLSIAALFFIAEFPRGIIWLLMTNNYHGWHICHNSLIYIFITIINILTSITFTVYYTLSEQFRTTFKSLFRRKPLTSISHQTHAPLASGDTKEIDSGWKTSEV